MLNKIRSQFSRIAKLLQFVPEYATDAWLYARYNGYSPFQNIHLRRFYKIIIETHTVEKGLSLPAPRLLFGRQKIDEITGMLRGYDVRFSPLPAAMALGAFSEYTEFHKKRQIDDPYLRNIADFVRSYGDGQQVEAAGGIKCPRSLQPIADDPDAYREFLITRSSYRIYQDVRLEDEIVRAIVNVAQSAPSQCNRQATNVYVFRDKAQIQRLLRLQRGSAGFLDNVPNLFVVTSDIAAWGGPQQRNQLYVDGALFSMMLMLSAHAIGVGTCPLNLAVTNAQEREIKQEAGIPQGQRLIMMIAAGYVPEDAMVAFSPRRPVEEIMTIRN